MRGSNPNALEDLRKKTGLVSPNDSSYNSFMASEVGHVRLT